MIRIYPASKVKHAQKWLDLHRDHPNFFFHARWLKASKNESDFNDVAFEQLWRMCQEDVRDADVLLAYAEKGDTLKGAFVEVGMALAYGVKVVEVGCEGSWVNHEGVTRFDTLEDALEYMSQ
jgi:hypothetical protein